MPDGMAEEYDPGQTNGEDPGPLINGEYDHVDGDG